MKTILNKKTHVKDSATEITYSELIMSVVKSQDRNEGFNFDTLKSISRIDKVASDKTKKKFEFEDSDYEFLKSKLASMKWAFFDQVFIDFTEYINGGGESK